MVHDDGWRSFFFLFPFGGYVYVMCILLVQRRGLGSNRSTIIMWKLILDTDMRKVDEIDGEGWNILCFCFCFYCTHTTHTHKIDIYFLLLLLLLVLEAQTALLPGCCFGNSDVNGMEDLSSEPSDPTPSSRRNGPARGREVPRLIDTLDFDGKRLSYTLCESTVLTSGCRSIIL